MGSKMKAAFFRKTGGAEVIEWGDLEIPELKDNEILVKTKAVAVEHVDTYVRSGKYPLPQGATLPFIVGHDVVGVVEKTGKNVTLFKPGQRVWSITLGANGLQGTCSEYVVGPAVHFFPVPDGVDDVEMIAAAQAGVTACLGLIKVAELKSNEVIFINGGSGSVGSAVIQLSALRGCRVFASATGEEKMEWCKNCGAELVVDYKKNDIEKKVRELSPKGVDVFWDTSPSPHFELSVALLAFRGRIVLMSGSGSAPPFPVGPFYAKEGTMKGFALFNTNPSDLRNYADIVNRCILEKCLKIKIAEVLPLSETGKAHALLESQPNLWGKIILKN